MILEAEAVHTKGRACRLCSVTYSRMARCSSRTLRKLPRRTRLRVSSAKKRSSWLSQLAPLGVKCQ
jgi:hypothetical protein